MGLLLVTPFGLLFLAFLVAPLVYAFWLSLRTSTLVGGDHFSWFTNYKQTFTDPHFLSGVRRVIVFGLVQIPVMLGLALLGALIIDEVSSRLAKVFRMTLFMPYAVPAVIGALMWGFLYSPTFGPVNSLSHALGLGKVGLLGHSLMLTSLGNIVTWQWTGDSVNTYAVNDLVAVVDAVEDKEAAEFAAEYVESYDVVPALRPGGIRHDSLLYAARLELGLRGFLTEGGFTAFTTNFEDLGGLRQLPGIAVQRLMADGYGFGGEGDWKTSALLRTIRSWAPDVPAAPASWRTTPTTSARALRASSAPTCWRSAPRWRPTAPAARSTPCPSAAARTRSVWSSTRPRAPPSSSASPTSATASG
jgi:hypothetical protein